MFDCAIPEIKKNNCFNAIRLFCCLIVIFEHAVVLTNQNIKLIGGGFRVIIKSCGLPKKAYK